MYYYIFETPKNTTWRTYVDKIQQISREFSITGEISFTSPARTAQELVQIGITKRYSTIVAVGSDTHINRIINQLVNNPPDIPIALGIISTDPSMMLYEKWGFKKPEEACEMLKYRKLERFDVGFIEPNHYFFTSARIECKKPTRIILEVDRWKVEGVIDRAEVSRNLYILLEKFTKKRSITKSIINWFVGKEDFDSEKSIFKGKIIRISSSDSLPVYVGNEVIAYTPINIYRKIHALNIITKRDIPKESSANIQ